MLFRPHSMEHTQLPRGNYRKISLDLMADFVDHNVLLLLWSALQNVLDSTPTVENILGYRRVEVLSVQHLNWTLDLDLPIFDLLIDSIQPWI